MAIPASLICVLFLICGHTLFCHSQTDQDAQTKNGLVEDIAQKVSNLSLKELANISTKEKTEVLIKIEQNLNKSAKLLGLQDSKYVKLIMKGLKIRAFNKDVDNTLVNNIDSTADNHSDDKLTTISNCNDISDNGTRKISNVSSANLSGKDTPRHILNVDSKSKVTNQTSKEKLINDIVKKMEILANNYHKGTKTKYAHQKAIELVKHKFEERAKQNHSYLRKQHDTIKSYAELVRKGIHNIIILRKNEGNGNIGKIDLPLNNVIYTKKLLNTGNIGSALQDSKNNNLDKGKIKENVEMQSRRQGYEVSKENVTDTRSIRSPLICECDAMNCKKNCTQECENVCWKKYSLSRWQCQAVNGQRSVALDSICNGKLDCYDETDESGCSEERSLAKYKAMEIYNEILNLIMVKTSMAQYKMIRNNLLTLRDLTLKLQHISLVRYADAYEVKRVRENCFTELTKIYDNVVQSASTPDQVAEIYTFLLNVNEKLVSALKRSQGDNKSVSGNDKSITSNGCLCKNNECARPRCSTSCSQVCAAQPKLTRYFCDGSSSLNSSVSIDALCNGKADCPGGDDEEKCSEEVCRSHHLILLRLNLRDAGEMYKGTAMGEALIHWKTKVSAKLTISESGSRPTPTIIKDLVQEILQELVMSYASISDNRRSSGSSLDEYLKWSRVVIGAVKSCGH